MKNKLFKRGDTLVEILFAVGIFGAVAIGAIGIMNKGMYDAQKALEINMARNEIDAQAEALRFLQDSYIKEKKIGKPIEQRVYTKIWDALKELAFKPSELPNDFYRYNNLSCDEIYNTSVFKTTKTFIINTRRIDYDIAETLLTSDEGGTWTSPSQPTGDAIIVHTTNSTDGADLIARSPIYPRILYSNVFNRNYVTDITEELSDKKIATNGRVNTTYFNTITKAQGIWINSVSSSNDATPEYYDYYIRTCWDAPGSSNSVTVSTTVRLFNPDK